MNELKKAFADLDRAFADLSRALLDPLAADLIRFLLWIGFVARRADGGIAWPFRAPPMHVFTHYLRHDRKPYLFRNLPGVIKWVPGRLLPRRWGFGWLGFEFGDRGH